MVIKRKIIWSAWAPGVTTRQEWGEWSQNLRGFDITQKPDVSFIKPMVRRRLSSLAKMVFATSQQLISEEQEVLSLVFASRYGDLEKTVQLLASLGRDEALSPTTFGLSVHNSLVGMYGLIKKWTQASTAISAGRKTLSAGLIEAYSQSKSIKSPVLFFYYDEPLPEVYQQYSDGNEQPLCIGIIVDASDDSLESMMKLILAQPEISPLNFINTLLTQNV